MAPERARYVAAFAYVLSRVANADRNVSDDETRVMTELVTKLGNLPEAQAALVVEMAKSRNRLYGGTENYLVTRELAGITTREEREHMLHCVFAVAVADDSISSIEESQLRQVASELGFGHEEFVAIRSAYNEKREVVKLLRRQQG